MTYPNVLVMGYLEETGQLTPKWRMKLEAAINAGYQRLLTFEVDGGGFDWYGRAPAKTMLTAYGILELSDMNKVYPIDTRVIDRARDVLYDRQYPGGSWALDVREHTWSRGKMGNLPVTAYVVWALKEAGYEDQNVERAIRWLEANKSKADDPYIKALVALALGDRESIERLEECAVEESDMAYWVTKGEGLYRARGMTASIEATALAALALLRFGRSRLIDKALTKIARSKDASGSWHSTQATILCIKALLDATKIRTSPAEDVPVRLVVNGKEIEGAFKPLSPETYDVVQQVEIPVKEGENVVELRMDGEARAAFQVFGRYYLPWELVPEPAESPITIETSYDKTELDLTDKLEAVAMLKYEGPGTFMVIADLGIPPGFTPDAESFERLVKSGTIDKFTITGRQITLYFGRVQSRSYRIEYTLTPRFPIKAMTPRSGAYEYYTPQNKSSGRPQELRVRR